MGASTVYHLSMFSIYSDQYSVYIENNRRHPTGLENFNITTRLVHECVFELIS
jgi:hypothetical protein